MHIQLSEDWRKFYGIRFSISGNSRNIAPHSTIHFLWNPSEVWDTQTNTTICAERLSELLEKILHLPLSVKVGKWSSRSIVDDFIENLQKETPLPFSDLHHWLRVQKCTAMSSISIIPMLERDWMKLLKNKWRCSEKGVLLFYLWEIRRIGSPRAYDCTGLFLWTSHLFK